MGPLDDKGKPISRKNGQDYLKWIDNIKAFGYSFDSDILNAADFGAYQSRERLFIQFSKHGLPIKWPEPTHAKLSPIKSKNQTNMFDNLGERLPWKPVKEILDLNNEGESIFNRKKKLSENTLKRIYAGLIKFVAKGHDSFTKQYNSGNDSNRVKSINEPVGAITTGNSHAIIKSNFIKKYYSGRPEGKVISVDGPAGTVKCIDGQAVVTATHLNTYYGNGGIHDINHPSPTITTKDRISKVDVDQFIMNQYSGGGQHTDINGPSSTVTNIPKQNLISTIPWVMDTNFKNIGKSIDETSSTLVACRKYPYLINANSSTSPPNELNTPSPTITSVRTHYIINAESFILNPSWGGNNGSVEEPCCTVIARQDKAPLYIVNTELNQEFTVDVSLFFEEHDFTLINDIQKNVYGPMLNKSIRVKIIEFMAMYGIINIKMRMLSIPELKQIQGFPKDYKLKGTQTEQKKYIGNAVEVNCAKAIIKANYESISKYKNSKVA